MLNAFFSSLCLLFLLCISGSFPQSVLIATEQAINILEDSSVETVHNNISASSVDFRYGQKEFYFAEGRTMFYSYYSYYNGSREEPLPTVTANHTVSDLTVDWEHYRLYYTVMANRSIYETTLLGPSSELILNDVTYIGGLALDPYEQLLFYITDKRLKSYNLTRRTVHREYDWSNDGIAEVVQVAVNIHRKELVVVGTGEGGDWRMVVADYPHSRARPALSSWWLHNASAVTVFGDRVVWSTGDSLYGCQLTPDCDESNVALVYKSEEIITDVKLYSPLVHTPSPQEACQLCSHSCSIDSHQTVSCSCPEHMQLVDAGGVLCENELLTTWLGEVREFFSSVVTTCNQWLESPWTPFILMCCGVLVASISCCFWLLKPRNKRKRLQRSESISLNEWRRR